MVPPAHEKFEEDDPQGPEVDITVPVVVQQHFTSVHVCELNQSGKCVDGFLRIANILAVEK